MQVVAKEGSLRAATAGRIVDAGIKGQAWQPDLPLLDITEEDTVFDHSQLATKLYIYDYLPYFFR